MTGWATAIIFSASAYQGTACKIVSPVEDLSQLYRPNSHREIGPLPPHRYHLLVSQTICIPRKTPCICSGCPIGVRKQAEPLQPAKHYASRGLTQGYLVR